MDRRGVMGRHALWRILAPPLYMVCTGLAFAAALRNTAGSILAPLAPIAPWALAVGIALALLSAAGGLIRARPTRAAGTRSERRRPPAHVSRGAGLASKPR